jgi:hypothetical protein
MRMELLPDILPNVDGVNTLCKLHYSKDKQIQKQIHIPQTWGTTVKPPEREGPLEQQALSSWHFLQDNHSGG